MKPRKAPIPHGQAPAKPALSPSPFRSNAGRIQDAVLLVAGFGWIALGVDPTLRCQHGCPVLILEDAVWQRLWFRPGGILEGLAAAAAQLDRFPFVAAALFSGLIGLTVLAIRSGVGPSRAVRPLSWLPGLTLLVAYGQYACPAWEHAAGILLATGALAAWQRWTPGTRPGRLAALWISGAAVFYLGGTAPCLLLVASAAASDATARRDWLSAALGVLAALLVPAGWICSSEADASAVWRRWGRGLSWVLAWTAYGATVAAVLAGAWFARRDARLKSPPRGLAAGWLSLVIPAVAVWAVVATFDPQLRLHLRLHWAGQHGRWGEVIAAGRGLSNPSPGDRLQIRRALFHTGRLCNDLFAFAHRPGEELLPSLEAGPDAYAVLSDTLLELGHVNLAERYAHEAIETLGERPALLQRLARINALKDRPAAARVFLGRLAKMPFERAWAETQLQALARDPSLASDPVVSAIRPRQVKGHLTEARFPTEMLLTESLRTGGTNRMAFEFLIAHLLLNQRVDALLSRLPDFKANGFARLPRHVSEAVLLHQTLHPDSPVNLAGWKIPDEISARFEQYRSATRERSAAAAALAHRFGDTFWYFAQSGARDR